MTGTEIHRCTQTLRLHLLDMCRVSQKCVDYSMKAFQSGRQEFSTTVLDSTHEIGLFRNDAMEIACDLMLAELPSAFDIRFVLASLRMSDALQAIQKEAFEIAEASLLFGEGEEIDSADLTIMGDLANRLMRLCTVAIFDEEIAHAEDALRMEAERCPLATTAGVWYRQQLDRRSPSQAAYVFSIAERLDELILHTREVARAIVFWLEDHERDRSPETYSFEPAEFFTASPQSAREFEPDYCI